MHWAKTAFEKYFIQPGKPTQNAFVESLNGKFRNECLNQHWSRILEEARWEIDHNFGAIDLRLIARASIAPLKID